MVTFNYSAYDTPTGALDKSEIEAHEGFLEAVEPHYRRVTLCRALEALTAHSAESKLGHRTYLGDRIL